jgi:hypothetical protein
MTATPLLVVSYFAVGPAVAALTFARETSSNSEGLFSNGAQSAAIWQRLSLGFGLLVIAMTCWPIFLGEWLRDLIALHKARRGVAKAAAYEPAPVGGAAFLAALFAPAIIQRDKRPNICPVCGHAPVAVVLYGAPTHFDLEGLRRGLVVSGGCILKPRSALWKCTACRQFIYETGRTPNNQD